MAWYHSLMLRWEMVIFENSVHMAQLEETDHHIQVVRNLLHRVEEKR